MKTKETGRKSGGTAGKAASSGKAEKRTGRVAGGKKHGSGKVAAKKTSSGAGRAGGKKAAETTADIAPAKRKANDLRAAELREFKELLLGMRNRIIGQIESLKGESLRRPDSVYSEEDGTDAFDRQMALDLVGSEHDALFEVDDALQRIEDRTYGLCAECNESIGKERLKALPFVKLCIKCKAALEQSQSRLRE